MKAVTVPVLIDFDQTKVVGSLTIREDALPTDFDFVFSIGYLVHKENQSGKLMCVSLSTDAQYLAFLRLFKHDLFREFTP